MPLVIDSLLPISADIDAENGYKKGLGKKVSEIDTLTFSKLRVRDEVENIGKGKYTKL